MSFPLASAPAPTHRLIPSRFPPIGLFDTVATASDLRAVIDLEGWTNDRLVADRIDRLPRADWPVGAANASIIMASFLHAAPGGMRFNGPDLGAWYAGASLPTAIFEVAHHLRREAASRDTPALDRCYRQYTASLDGLHVDIRGRRSDHPDICSPTSYRASQIFGENVRASPDDGILYDSVRHRSGTNAVAYRPRHIQDVAQAAHYRIEVQVGSNRISAKLLTT